MKRGSECSQSRHQWQQTANFSAVKNIVNKIKRLKPKAKGEKMPVVSGHFCTTGRTFLEDVRGFPAQATQARDPSSVLFSIFIDFVWEIHFGSKNNKI